MERMNLKFISFLAFSLLIIALLAGCSGNRTQETAGQYLDSSAITTRVKTRLLEDKTIKSRQIKVVTYKNRVQLSGFVESKAQAQRAEAIARSVPGVAAVENDIIVR